MRALRIGPRKLIAIASALMVAGAARIAWIIGGASSLIVLSIAVMFCGIVAVAYLGVQAERRVTDHIKIIAERFDPEATPSLAFVTDRLEHIVATLSYLSTEIKGISENDTEQSDRLYRLEQALERVRPERGSPTSADPGPTEFNLGGLPRNSGAAISPHDSRDSLTFRQVEALVDLYIETGATVAFPDNRTFMAAPDLLLYLHRLVRNQGFQSIIECGSGLSTVIMAYALRANGMGQIWSLEHLDSYAERTLDLLTQHNLLEWADVRYAPLEQVQLDDSLWSWYSLDRVPDGPFDLLVVDGPPGSTDRHARYPALPLLNTRLSDNAFVVLDDYGRTDERHIATKWLEEFPGLTPDQLDHEKGTLVLRIDRTP